jgi:hypothetical protein
MPETTRKTAMISSTSVDLPEHRLYNEVGGFRCLLALVYDHWQDQQGWDKSTCLLAEEVMPRLADFTGA